jgi:hypothetical protein
MAPRAIQQSEPDRAELVSFLEGVDGTRIVLSMFFFPELKGLRVDWSKKTNVYLDLGCCKPSSASFDELASWFPVERVVFGTGAPFYYWKGSRLALEGSRLSETDRTGILGGHAMEIFPWK